MLDRSMTRLEVHCSSVVYPYHVGSGCLDLMDRHFAAFEADLFIVVTDDNVLDLHGAAFTAMLEQCAPVLVCSRPAGDGMKAADNLAAHLEAAIGAGATRRSVVVAFGGGVPGNLAGLVAALLFRGVRLVHVPTTTVSAMDSTLSLKQAINSSHGKNHIGTYHTPEAVFLDLDFLRTLPDKQLRSGLCEAAKNCLAIRPDSIAWLRSTVASGSLTQDTSLTRLLQESLAAKAEVTAADPREQHRGLVLEYGHTVGHAIEVCDRRVRGAEALSHGEAVMLGMLAAARLSAEVCGLSEAEVAVHHEIATMLGAPTVIPEGITRDAIMNVIRVDNKRGYLEVTADEGAFVLLRELGTPDGRTDLPLVTVPLKQVSGVIDDMITTVG